METDMLRVFLSSLQQSLGLSGFEVACGPCNLLSELQSSRSIATE